MLNRENIKKLVHFVLLSAASEEDYTRRNLGEIHLLKYLYIADEAHARWHNGQTFTGGDWMFYKFGPWSQAIYAVVVACLAELNAEARTISSRFGKDDYKRWSVQFDESLLHELKKALPLDVKQSVLHAVHRHTNDTATLLEEVYASEPMLQSAPGESLEFRAVQTLQAEEKEEVFVPFLERLSKSDRKLFQIARKEAASKIADHLAQCTTLPSLKTSADPDCEEILNWLNGMAGPHLGVNVKLVFCDSVWKSASRRGGEA